jgi:hypothetical protein
MEAGLKTPVLKHIVTTGNEIIRCFKREKRFGKFINHDNLVATN